MWWRTMVKKDLPDIARIFVKNNKVKFITIPSNGSLTDLMTKGAEKMLLKIQILF